MSTIIAYAIAVFINLGVISPNDVNRTTSTLTVVEKDGKTVVIDSASGAETIIYL